MISNGNFSVLSSDLRSRWETATFNEHLLISKSQKRERCFLFVGNSDGNWGLKPTQQILSNGKLQYKNQIKPSVSIMITTHCYAQTLSNYNVTITNNLYAALI